MGSKTYIKLKRGILEAKHHQRMGVAIWLFLYFLDRTNWENGTVQDYRDQEAADRFGVSKRTARTWRKTLEMEGYISTRQSYQCQRITVHNWTNPRESWEQGLEFPTNLPPMDREDEAEFQPSRASRLSAYFENQTKIPALMGGASKWNKEIQKWIEADLIEEDILNAIRILRKNGYPINGPWSITKTATGEMSRRKSEASQKNLNYDEVYR